MKTFLILSIILLLSLTSCMKSISLTRDTANGAVTVRKNAVFKIEMESNPTTGYGWKWTNREEDRIVDTIGFDYQSGFPGRIGGGGTEIWKFRAMEQGTDTLQFIYCRSWQPNSAAGRKTVVVKVK